MVEYKGVCGRVCDADWQWCEWEWPLPSGFLPDSPCVSVLQPFVHPDCGAHYGVPFLEETPAMFVRWAQFCAMGSIIRFHTNDCCDHRYVARPPDPDEGTTVHSSGQGT